MYIDKIFVGENLPRAFKEEENQEYFEKLLLGDYSARNTLIEHNLKLVIYIVRKLENNKEDSDDIISIGTIGLIKAVDTFNYDYKTKFSTYAGRCITNEIFMFFRKQKNKRLTEVNLDDSFIQDEDGNDLTILETLFDEGPTGEEWLEDNETCEELAASFSVLSNIESAVIKMRYGFVCLPMTQQEVAKILNYSRSYISRIETKAKLKIANFLKTKSENDLGKKEMAVEPIKASKLTRELSKK